MFVPVYWVLKYQHSNFNIADRRGSHRCRTEGGYFCSEKHVGLEQQAVAECGRISSIKLLNEFLGLFVGFLGYLDLQYDKKVAC